MATGKITTQLIRQQQGSPIHTISDDLLYVGVDIAKTSNVAGFVSHTLLARHERFENCPAIAFEQSRDGYRKLLDRIKYYVPFEQCFVLMEVTGHYHKSLEQYLVELEIPVYLMHVQKRMSGMMKTDKRDALGLANHLYNQLEKGIQVTEKKQIARRILPNTSVAAQLKNLVQYRSELIRESTRRKNKLTAICDELFPEFTKVFKDPNGDTALHYRDAYPTPSSIASASIQALSKLRAAYFPSQKQLVLLQELAAQTIGTKNIYRQQGLVLEQTLLIQEQRLVQKHLQTIDTEVSQLLHNSREGKILLSIPSMGTIMGATIISTIGNINNFETAGHLKSYFGWSPTVQQTGTTLDSTSITRGGVKQIKAMMYMLVWRAINNDTEWSKIYERLVVKKCAYDERKKQYIGKKKVIGRIAGQMLKLIYALLKADQDLLNTVAYDKLQPEPVLYNMALHKSHREGKYLPQQKAANTIIQVVKI